MKAVYSIIVGGEYVSVVESGDNGLSILNPLVLLLPGHIRVEKVGEDSLFINDVWDVQKALSKQTLRVCGCKSEVNE